MSKNCHLMGYGGLTIHIHCNMSPRKMKGAMRMLHNNYWQGLAAGKVEDFRPHVLASLR